MKKQNKLFFYKKPYDMENTNQLFLEAVQENCRFHYDHCEDYARILKSRGFHPDDLKEYEDIAKLPFIPTLYFKRHKLFSVPEKKLLIKATSSGTGGLKTHMGFDAGSLFRGYRMIRTVGKYHHLFSVVPNHYIVFGYEPNRNNEVAFAKTAYGFTFFTPALSRDYVLRYTKDGYKTDLEHIKKKLIQYSRAKFPVRTIGFPAYTYFVLKQLKEEGVKLKLPRGSVMTLGGGWKQFYQDQISKQEFYTLTEEVLGIKENAIFEFFGAVEHPILYTDCRCHRFHVPVYSRVIIRDVDTLEPVTNGTPGLVNLITPMTDSVPMLSIMTDDIGILHDGACDCGEKSPWLEILGRVGVKDIVTCAAGAANLLKKEELS